MRASIFEFRNRFWIISGIFFVAFFAYSVDHRNVVQALLGWLGHITGRDMSTATNFRLLFGVAALVIFAAGMLRTWAAAYLQSEVVHDSELHSDRLVADGPYRHLRNPLYLGTMLLSVGLGACASVTGFAVLVAGITLFCYRLMLREEAELGASHSASYREYRERVPRILPSLRPRIRSSGRLAHWGQALRGETMMWLFGCAVAAFAATLNGKVFQIMIAVALVLGFLVTYSTRRKQTNSVSEAKAR
jgi:protein-S-isoprenylcysteine O-methyltransferase Ste14